MIIVRNCKFGASRIMVEEALTLEEMLADPIVQLVMRRDGVTAAEVRRLMAELHARRARKEPSWAQAAE